MATENNDKLYLFFGILLFIAGIIMIVYGGLYLSQSEAACSGINFTEGSSGTTDGTEAQGCCGTSQSTGGWLLAIGLIVFLVSIWMMYKGKTYSTTVSKATEKTVNSVANLGAAVVAPVTSATTTTNTVKESL